MKFESSWNDVAISEHRAGRSTRVRSRPPEPLSRILAMWRRAVIASAAAVEQRLAEGAQEGPARHTVQDVAGVAVFPRRGCPWVGPGQAAGAVVVVGEGRAGFGREPRVGLFGPQRATV